MKKLYLSSVRRNVGSAIKNNLKLLLGAIVYPVQARRWRRFVRGNSVLSDLAQQYPRISHKIYRPYLSSGLSCADRVDVLIGHYKRIFKAGLGELIGRAAVNSVPIAQFAGKSGALFELHLCAINDGHREGELTLKLMQQERCLYVSSFVLVTLGGEPSIALGALQGLRSSDGAAIIKDVTRELHGCRPKKLMVSVVRALGEHFGATRIMLVSNENRIAVNGRRARRISSNYDETWQEMGATRRADGNFELPCTEPGHDIELVPSHKRALARRRAALLAAICATAQSSLKMPRLYLAHPAPGAKPVPLPTMSLTKAAAR